MESATQPSAVALPVPRLLIVDDEPDNLDVLCRLCRRHGYKVFSATTGAEALKLAGEVKPDLMLVDVMLPDLTGLEVCRAIRANPALEDVFIALISSVEITADSAIGGLTGGADEYITRPIANQELVARLGALLRIQRALTARRQAEARLAQLNQTLEERVAARTAALAAAHETIRAVPQQLIAAQERERHRMARELHDGVSQLLASVRFRLLAVEGWLHDHADDTLRREVSRAKDYLDAASREVRDISQQLRPRVLDDLGLHAAIHSATDGLRGNARLRIQCRLVRLPKRLPAEVELALYRIFQEALANILKHAKAKRITVTLLRAQGGITLRLTDDGRGFVAQSERRSLHASLGLVNMRERAESIQGVLTVKSVPREGTTIEVWMPLPKSPEKQTNEC